MAIDPKRAQDEHNRGERDAAEGRGYNPKWNSFETTSPLNPNAPQRLEDNEHYDAGWRNAKDQKDSNEGGGCFLTTACCTHAGLGDDCRELAVLRQFRDNYVANLPDGGSIIAEYYLVAPRIVEGIIRSTHPALELERIYSVVTESVRLVEAQRFSEAFALYESLFRTLKEQYVRA